MASERRIQANRENAMKSTGPQSDGGRQRSSRNSTKHGLTAKRIVLADEDREEFEQLREAYYAEFQPEGAVEEELVGQLVMAAWRLRRTRHAEVDAFGNRIPHTKDAFANLDPSKVLIAKTTMPCDWLLKLWFSCRKILLSDVEDAAGIPSPPQKRTSVGLAIA